MQEVPSDVWEALGDSVIVRRLWGFATYKDRTATLELGDDGDIKVQASGSVQTDASITVVGYGDPLVTGRDTDLLAPFGQEVTLYWEVRYGDLSYTLPMGIFRVTSNDGGTVNRRNGVALDWVAEVELKDRFHILDRARVFNPASPVPGNTMYDEIRRLAINVPVLENPGIEDRSVPAGLEYKDRLDSIYALADLAGATPHMTRQGALTLRPNDRWLTATVPDFTISAIIEWDDYGQTDEFYNYVWAHDPDNKWSAFVPLDEPGNPRSVENAGMSSYELSTPVITSQAGAVAAGQTALARLQRERSVVVTVTVGPQALALDVGDFGWFIDEHHGRKVLGEVSSISIPNNPTAPLTVEVIAAERHTDGIA